MVSLKKKKTGAQHSADRLFKMTLAQKAKERTGKEHGGKIPIRKDPGEKGKGFTPKWTSRPGKRRKTAKKQRTSRADKKINPQWLEEKYNVELKAEGGRIEFKKGKAVTKADLAKSDLERKRQLKKRADKKREKKWDIKDVITSHPLNPFKIHAQGKAYDFSSKRKDVYVRTRDDLKKSKDPDVKKVAEGFQKMDYKDKAKGTQFEKDYETKLKKKEHKRRNAEGGIISLKKGGKADNKWIQKATKGMRKDKPCTGKKFGSATCPPGSKRYNLAQTFKKMARSKHASGDMVRYI